MSQQDRLEKITRCMKELEEIRWHQTAGHCREVQPHILLGEMDWLEALHYLIHDEDTE